MWIQHINKKTLSSLLIAGAMLSAPTRRVDIDHVGNYNFKVEIEGVTAGHFTGVDGLSIEQEVIEYREGEDLVLKKRPGRVKFGDITLKRGEIIPKLEIGLLKWRETVHKVAGSDVEKKNGSIALYSDEGALLMKYNFYNAWPSKVSGPNPKNDGNDLAIEEVTLAVESIELGR